MTDYDKHLLTSNGYKVSEVLKWKDKGKDLLKTLRRPNKKGGYMKPVNMATGGLMNRPLGYKSEDKKDTGISAYDVDSPASARQGMPSRLLGRDRTRFEHGGFHSVEEVKKYLNNPKNKEELNKIKEKMSDENFKNFLLNMSKEKFKKEKPMKKKPTTISVASGGLLDSIGKYRKGYYKGDKVGRDEIDTIDEEAWEYMTDESDIAQNKSIDAQIEREEIRKEIARADNKDTSVMDRNIQKLKEMKNKKVVTAALGGVMDENQIAEQTPLALSIGGQAALGEKYDRRKDYKAYAEGDIVEEDVEVEEPLMAPTGMNFDTPVLDEDAIAETDMEMEAEDNMEMEAEDDMGDMDGVLDTSMLSEEEEKVLDEAVEMHPELEAIIPKIVATEFTEDELVEGPGTGTSDSIPALLSDGEFVFTAKAVKNIGIDKLRKMMKQAEEAYDAGMVQQEDAATMANEEESLLA